MVTRCVAAHFVAQNLTLSVETLLLGRNVLPHPRQVAGGVLGTALLGRLLVLEQSSEHVRFRVTCSFVWQRKGLEQTWHVFQNGYVLFALKCLGVFENRSSASFNKAAMVSRDELVCMISEKTVGGILVWVDVDLLDGLPLEAVMLCIIAECETPFHESMVRFPPYLGKDLCVLTQAAEHVVDAIADLEPGVLDSRGGPMRRPRESPDEHVPTRLEDPVALGHHLLHEPHEAIPLAEPKIPNDLRRLVGLRLETLAAAGTSHVLAALAAHRVAVREALGRGRDPVLTVGVPVFREVRVELVWVVPVLAHERDARGRVSDDRVDRRARERPQNLAAVPLEDLVRL
jgi:hypothetical protein